MAADCAESSVEQTNKKQMCEHIETHILGTYSIVHFKSMNFGVLKLKLK